MHGVHPAPVALVRIEENLTGVAAAASALAATTGEGDAALLLGALVAMNEGGYLVWKSLDVVEASFLLAIAQADGGTTAPVLSGEVRLAASVRDHGRVEGGTLGVGYGPD